MLFDRKAFLNRDRFSLFLTPVHAASLPSMPEWSLSSYLEPLLFTHSALQPSRQGSYKELTDGQLCHSFREGPGSTTMWPLGVVCIL